MSGKKLPFPVSAQFLAGASHVLQLPAHSSIEVAVFGRSNVGKSTFINRMSNNKHLARTSKTPGRTKEINLFQIDIRVSPSSTKSLYLADLPGYGYAKVSKHDAGKLEVLIGDYLEERTLCSCGCILVDIRRDPEGEEILLQEEFFKKGVPALFIATKADKLSNNEKKNRISAIAKKLHLEPPDLLISGEGMDISPIWKRILMGATPKGE